MLSVSIQVLQRKGARCGVISIKDTSETSGGVSVGAIRQTEGEAEFGQMLVDKLGGQRMEQRAVRIELGAA